MSTYEIMSVTLDAMISSRYAWVPNNCVNLVDFYQHLSNHLTIAAVFSWLIIFPFAICINCLRHQNLSDFIISYFCVTFIILIYHRILIEFLEKNLQTNWWSCSSYLQSFDYLSYFLYLSNLKTLFGIVLSSLVQFDWFLVIFVTINEFKLHT